MKTQSDCTTILLPDVAVGHRARVVSVSGGEAFRRRLLELGFVPGTEVERLATGLAEPASYRLRGAVVALRRIDAGHVVVEAR